MWSLTWGIGPLREFLMAECRVILIREKATVKGVKGKVGSRCCCEEALSSLLLKRHGSPGQSSWHWPHLSGTSPWAQGSADGSQSSLSLTQAITPLSLVLTLVSFLVCRACVKSVPCRWKHAQELPGNQDKVRILISRSRVGWRVCICNKPLDEDAAVPQNTLWEARSKYFLFHTSDVFLLLSHK